MTGGRPPGSPCYDCAMRWALLFVILVSVAGGCQSYRDRKAIHAFLAEASPRLTPQRAALGEVEAEGNELTLLDGALTLAFRPPIRG